MYDLCGGQAALQARCPPLSDEGNVVTLALLHGAFTQSARKPRRPHAWRIAAAPRIAVLARPSARV